MDRRRVLRHAASAVLLVAAGLVASRQAVAGTDLEFTSIEGVPIRLDAFEGQPMLVVNTASLCVYTDQYDGLQGLYDRYRDRGLVVLGVPSDSFNQELATDAEVGDFCETNFALDLPLTKITPVTGPGAHPFYLWAARQGVVPRWNFHKILLDGAGGIVAEFPSKVPPSDPRVVQAIESVLPGS